MARKLIGKVCAENKRHRYTLAEYEALPKKSLPGYGNKEFTYCTGPGGCGSIAFEDITQEISEDEEPPCPSCGSIMKKVELGLECPNCTTRAGPFKRGGSNDY